jgi:hypothetical protein
MKGSRRGQLSPREVTGSEELSNLHGRGVMCGISLPVTHDQRQCVDRPSGCKQVRGNTIPLTAFS